MAGHGDLFRTVAINQNGKCFVSGSDDEIMKVWNDEEKRKEINIPSLKSGIIIDVNPISNLKKNILKPFVSDQRKKFCLICSSSSIDLNEFQILIFILPNAISLPYFIKKIACWFFTIFSITVFIEKCLFSPEYLGSLLSKSF